MWKRLFVVRRQKPVRSSTNTMRTVKYLACQKNHVASVGGYAIDGCREFMASEIEAKASLTCAACGCHRNFHKKEEEETEVMCDCSSTPSTSGNN